MSWDEHKSYVRRTVVLDESIDAAVEMLIDLASGLGCRVNRSTVMNALLAGAFTLDWGDPKSRRAFLSALAHGSRMAGKEVERSLGEALQGDILASYRVLNWFIPERESEEEELRKEELVNERILDKLNDILEYVDGHEYMARLTVGHFPHLRRYSKYTEI